MIHFKVCISWCIIVSFTKFKFTPEHYYVATIRTVFAIATRFNVQCVVKLCIFKRVTAPSRETDFISGVYIPQASCIP
jgi:hypothetical protein